VNKKIADLWCNWSYGTFLTAGALWPLVCGDRRCGRLMAQSATTLLASTIAVQSLKLIVPERRPDTGQKGSFPSGHSANTIALATLCSAQNPSRSIGWYLPALAISLSRIALRRHHVRDVVVGSLLGFALARHVAQRMR
jgi:membrane-associated phospholipid phosphatase